VPRVSSGDTPDPSAAAHRPPAAGDDAATTQPAVPQARVPSAPPPATTGYPSWSPTPTQPVIPAQPGPPMSAPPGYPYGWPGFPQYQVMPPPKRRRGWLRWLLGTALVSVLMVMLCCAGAVAGDLTNRAGDWREGSAPRASAIAPPAENAPRSEWRIWARTQADAALRAQAEALVKGDQEAFLAPADPAKRDLVSELTRRFKVLRAMGIGSYQQRISAAPDEDGTRAWRMETELSYCFGQGCTLTDLPVETGWAYRSGKLLLTGLEDSAEDWNGPRPWEVTDLSVKTGSRVVVAAAKANAWRLDEAVRAADRAAKVADSFAEWHPAPTRFVIFLAGPAEWRKWYGKSEPSWAAAWTVPVGTYESEVVVRTEVVRQSSLEDLLSHELTHVTSLAGDRDGVNSANWWLIEGIADYAAFGTRPNSQYDALAPVRRFVQGGRFRNDVAVSPPTDSAALEDAAARYGVAFLAVRHLAEKYGKPKMLTFFGKVVHDDDSLDVASRAAFGTPWTTVNADCVRYVKTVV
jgi:hypothetical protein